MGAPGAWDEKWPKDSHDVGGGMLIPWVKTVGKMDIVGSRNDEWKFGKNPIYSCRAHIATSFVPAATVIPERIERRFSDLESTRPPIPDVRVTG